jgi:hypothetical protein
MRDSILRSVVLSTLILGIVSVWLMARPDPIPSEPSRRGALESEVQQPTAAPASIVPPATPGDTRHLQPSAASPEPPVSSSAPASERELLREIETSVRLEREDRARSLADRFFQTYPASAATARIERLTGSHPRSHL